MKRFSFLGSLLFPIAVFGAATMAQALESKFTYQGRLLEMGVPTDGACDFNFSLHTSAAAGVELGSIALDEVAVIEGLFTVELDFGTGPFELGDDRWLEIEVRCPAGASSFTTLSPRQQLTATPFALYSMQAETAGSVAWGDLSGVPAGFADNSDDDTTYTAGTGLILAGSEFRLDTTSIQMRVAGSCAAGSSIRAIAGDGNVTCETDDDSGGDITAVVAGSGLSGGGTSGSVSLNLNFSGSGAAASAAHSDHDHGGIYAPTSHNHDGAQISSGTIADARIPASIARDNEILSTVLAGDGPGSGLNADLLDGQNASAFASNSHDHIGESWSGATPTGLSVTSMSTSGLSNGVFGQSNSTTGRGLLGFAAANTGATWGVWGEASSSGGGGVKGLALSSSGTTWGVWGESMSTDDDSAGVRGIAAGDGEGVRGESVNGAGIYGESQTGSGIVGRTESALGLAIDGYASSPVGLTVGVWGAAESNTGVGVAGIANSTSGGVGGLFTSATDQLDLVLGGFRGGINSDPLDASSSLFLSANNFIAARIDADAGPGSGDPGFFAVLDANDQVLCIIDENGGFGCTGTKAAVVDTEQYGTRKLYAVESPEVWFEDVGSAALVDGVATVDLEPIFSQTINAEAPYHVFTTPSCDIAVLLFVTEKLADRFSVRGVGLGGEPSDCSFDYRVIAKRSGYESIRLEESD